MLLVGGLRHSVARALQLYDGAETIQERPGFGGAGSLSRLLQKARIHRVDSSGLATDFDWVGRKTSVDLKKWFS
jgi:hypothetical protein